VVQWSVGYFSIISMAKGGRRPGSGRKKGSTTRPQLRDFFTPAEVKAFAKDLKKAAKEDNTLKKEGRQHAQEIRRRAAIRPRDGISVRRGRRRKRFRPGFHHHEE
jgi:hypothetical protein